MHNLVLRILTAVVLVIGLIGLLFYANGLVVSAALYIVGLLAVWELWRFVKPRSWSSFLMMAVLFSVASAQFYRHPSVYFLLGLGLTHVGITVWVLNTRRNLLHLVSGLYGAVLIASVIASVVMLQSFGPWVLLSAMMLVWATDIGGYFFGKAFGGKFIHLSLAPNISPKKSWEGAIGGVCLATVISAFGILITRDYPQMQTWLIPSAQVKEYLTNHSNTTLFLQQPWLLLVAAIAAYSISGDLLESLFKRQAGVKDSSQLLPGHGGILDRIDALIPVLPLCAAWAYFAGYR